jgi:hypothetical protein
MSLKVCSKCKKILVNGRWIVEVLPIQKFDFTVCPQCEGKGEDAPSGPGMVYQEYIRKQKKTR